MGATTTTTGSTRVCYQDSTTAINVIATTNAFDTGKYIGTNYVIPAGQARANTPIAVLGISDGASWSQVCLVSVCKPGLTLHLFNPITADPYSVFLSEKCLERVGLHTSNWLPRRYQLCVTNEGFAGVPDSQLLYVVESSGIVRIRFVSAGVPDTFSEAVLSGSEWSLAPLTI